MTETKPRKHVKRCKHGMNMGRSCSEGCSRYKLTFQLKSTHAKFKVIGKGGRIVNPAIWCFLKANNRPAEQVFAEMLKRIKAHEKYSMLYYGSNNIRLYDTQTDNYIEYKP